MKFLDFVFASSFASVFLALFSTRPSCVCSSRHGVESDEFNNVSVTDNVRAFVANPFSFSSSTVSTVADTSTKAGAQWKVTKKSNSNRVVGTNETQTTPNKTPGSDLTNNTILTTTPGTTASNDAVFTRSSTEKYTLVHRDVTVASEANNSGDTLVVISSAGNNKSVGLNETSAKNSSTDGASQCPESCFCPRYLFWAHYLLPYLRQQLGSAADNVTDDVMKFFLLQQFIVSAESSETILGRLFERVMSEGNAQMAVLLWLARFGVTKCTVQENTTFYLNAEAEARLFPQVKFKETLLSNIQKYRSFGNLFDESTTEPEDQGLESYQLYNITFTCKKGAKVVVTKEAALFRYGRWSSYGCQVVTEGILTLNRNWSLIELRLTDENALWFQNITVLGARNTSTTNTVYAKKNESSVHHRNDSILNSRDKTLYLRRDTVFPSIQDFSLINTSLSLQQLGQVLVWFQKAHKLSLRNNSLANFNCSQLIPSPAAWKSLVLSFSGLTSVPACVLRPSLDSLDLSNNSISNISVLQFPRFVPATNLSALILSNNNIRDVGIFADLKNLTFLLLAQNKISSLSKLSFTRLPELSYLDISGNLLHTLNPGSFKSLMYLQVLDLSHNSLEQFDRTVSPLRSYIPINCKIYLNFNRLSHPPFQREHFNPGTAYFVYASNNPFACDCAMSSFSDAINNSSLTGSYSDKSELRCRYPPALKGRRLEDIVFHDTCPLVLDCPSGCTCTLYRNDSVATVDCSSVDHVKSPEIFPQTHRLRLEFQSLNKTQTFTMFEDSEYLHRVISINVSGRGLTHIPDYMCEALKQAEMLDLSSNKLRRLPACFRSRPKDWPVLELRLANNPWSCDCDAVDLSFWLAEMTDGTAKKGTRVSDAREMWCSADTEPGVRVVEWDTSQCSPISFLPWAVTLGVVLAVAAIAGPLLYVYRLKAMVTIHARFHIRPFTPAPHYHEGDYDHEGLVVHGDSNTAVDWVLHALLPRTDQTQHRVCIPERDFLLGASLAESYAGSVSRSKATLCLLTRHVTGDDWWLYAFQLARAENARHPDKKFLLILLENVDEAELPEEIRGFMQTNTYLSVEDKWFWKKLFFYLPDPPKIQRLD